ncbi:hypothetical protein DIPPA_07754 [Diplonema papillatum]|nr:hypothetical protein DIPPA_07754 [Diplonema papillatum]
MRTAAFLALCGAAAALNVHSFEFFGRPGCGGAVDSKVEGEDVFAAAASGACVRLADAVYVNVRWTYNWQMMCSVNMSAAFDVFTDDTCKSLRGGPTLGPDLVYKGCAELSGEVSVRWSVSDTIKDDKQYCDYVTFEDSMRTTASLETRRYSGTTGCSSADEVLVTQSPTLKQCSTARAGYAAQCSGTCCQVYDYKSCSYVNDSFVQRASTCKDDNKVYMFNVEYSDPACTVKKESVNNKVWAPYALPHEIPGDHCFGYGKWSQKIFVMGPSRTQMCVYFRLKAAAGEPGAGLLGWTKVLAPEDFAKARATVGTTTTPVPTPAPSPPAPSSSESVGTAVPPVLCLMFLLATFLVVA